MNRLKNKIKLLSSNLIALQEQYTTCKDIFKTATMEIDKLLSEVAQKQSPENSEQKEIEKKNNKSV